MLLPFCKESRNFSFHQLSLCLFFFSAEQISTLWALPGSGGTNWNLTLIIIQEEILDIRTALTGKEKIHPTSISFYLTVTSAECEEQGRQAAIYLRSSLTDPGALWLRCMRGQNWNLAMFRYRLFSFIHLSSNHTNCNTQWQSSCG